MTYRGFDYRVVVNAAGYSWEFTNETEVVDGYTGLIDPFSVSRSIPEGDFWPAQPSPAVARFNVLVDDQADVEDLGADDTFVYAAFYSPAAAAEPLEEFVGRVSDLALTPHKLGVLVSVTAVDFLADLAEYPTRYGSAFPGTTSATINVVWGNSDTPFSTPTPYSPFGSPPDNPTVSENPDASDLATEMERYLASWIVDWSDPPFHPYGPYRHVIDQVADDSGLSGYRLLPMWRFLPTPAWSDVLDLDAGVVDLGGSFTLRKNDRPDAIDVNWLNPSTGNTERTSADRGGEGVPRATLDTRLVSSLDAGMAADFYLPSRGHLVSWVSDAFTWRLWASDEGDYLPRIYGGGRLGALVNVNDIASRWCPTGTTYSGVLSAYTLTVSRNRPTVSLSLRPLNYVDP